MPRDLARVGAAVLEGGSGRRRDLGAGVGGREPPRELLHEARSGRCSLTATISQGDDRLDVAAVDEGGEHGSPSSTSDLITLSNAAWTFGRGSDIVRT
jgi:hypothetical protein